jgi:argininosuccinate lyase
MKLWTEKINKTTDDDFSWLNNSLPVDKRLAKEDITGSLAWASALKFSGILSETEYQDVSMGLEKIGKEFEAGKFVFLETDEDIHTAVERRLTEIIGITGGKLHTGRSRNDQIATDFRLWMLNSVPVILNLIRNLQSILIQRAEQDFGVIVPGYTHLQQAQPILISHWWMSCFWNLNRDFSRFNELIPAVSVLPLGSAALAGSTIPIDQLQLAKILGFSNASPNSLDAVSDRDFAAEFLFNTTLTLTHLSRLAELLIIFNSHEFGFITLADEYTTGSSLMPQKKNPDLFELIRGKTGTILGHLTGMLATLKGLPSAYDKDLQEDKDHVFKAFDTLKGILNAACGAISSLSINTEVISRKMDWRMLATDLADYLVSKGLAFRQAHHVVRAAVSLADSMNVMLPEMPLDAWQSIHPIFDSDLYGVFNFDVSVDKHDVFGGTARSRVLEQIKLAKRVCT